jgi:exodeoxyribonuclease III
VLKIVTWNVNSLRVRLPQLLEWLASERPDIVALQETKLPDADFPLTQIQDAGYHALYSGQKTYNGVAILSRTPAHDPVRDVPGLDQRQRRIVAASYHGVRVLNLYVPNGQAVGSDKYAYKLEWMETLTGYVAAQLSQYPRLLVAGDFNVAPEERDVHDPKAWQGQVLFSEPERAAFRRLLAAGLSDSFRLFNQPDGSYSWWDYRMGAFRRNQGLRIDHILVSDALRAACLSCRIDKEARRRERPSDHAPVVAAFELDG